LGMVVFSTFPIPVLPLTQKREILQASIGAGSIGRGLAETDIAGGIERAVRYFEDRAFEGSRLVMLVSDGAGQVDGPDRLRVAHLLRAHRVALYWIYIRANNGPHIFERPDPGAEPSPERTLHEFFSAMPTPYKAYMAESAEDLQRAIADVSELQRLPVRYTDTTPPEDVSHWCYRIAFGLTLVLVGAKLLGLRRVRPRSMTAP
ncbi:MAG: vWA domain-containing protein, partial [Gammaproteobacteria bacterium]